MTTVAIPCMKARPTMAKIRILIVLLTATLWLGISDRSAKASEKARTPEQWMTYFSQNWKEVDWLHKNRLAPDGYMRPDRDKGWQARMLALQGLVKHGKKSIPILLETLKHGETPQRVLAAQALCFLAPDVPRDALVEAAKNDDEKAVRLYAVDALGMKGEAADKVDWENISEGQRNRDVRRHIEYAKERKNASIANTAVATLANWNASKMNSAVVGKTAPDFELMSANGEKIKLSDYRGKKTVVLVFVYGDT